ncbi:MAG: TonB family protein [Sandaracinaceae bacterium]
MGRWVLAVALALMSVPAVYAQDREHAELPGVRAPREVLAVVGRASHSLSACYERMVDPAPRIRGTTIILLTIEADGRVSRARSLRSSLGRPEIDRCLVTKLRRLRFPTRARAITVRIPFEFAGPARRSRARPNRGF